MFENAPRIVCLPEDGSIWTPSQVSHASNCGFECTRRAGRASCSGANHFPAAQFSLGAKPPRALGGAMPLAAVHESITVIDLSSWPRWLVVLVSALVLALVIWIMMK